MLIPKIIALDLDGTLFSRTGQITPYTKEQIRQAVSLGASVIISTGRPFVGLPLDEAASLGITYAITANGAAIYRLTDRVCLHEEGLPCEIAAPIIRGLYQKHLHLDAFIQGDAYTQPSTMEIARRSCLPESVVRYIFSTRKRVPDLADYIESHGCILQKATANFEQRPNGSFIDRNEAKAFLESCPGIRIVCGGYHNLEFTKAGVSKAAGLRFLCDYLNIPIEASMVCGDSENDADILQAAGLSVAMANADETIKNLCDYVTKSCDADGVGYAIQKFVIARAHADDPS